MLTLIIYSLCEPRSLSLSGCCWVCWQWRWFQQLSCTSSIAGSSLQLCRTAAGWHSSGMMLSFSGSLTSWRDHHDLRWHSLSFIHMSLADAGINLLCFLRCLKRMTKNHGITIMFWTCYHRKTMFLGMYHGSTVSYIAMFLVNLTNI